MRYHKTLLVWSEHVDKFKQASNIKDTRRAPANKKKFDTVKKVLIDILKENPDGLSLAQVPVCIKKRIPFNFDLNELGFPKLKDLILSIEEISLEHKGENCPKARLKKTSHMPTFKPAKHPK